MKKQTIIILITLALTTNVFSWPIPAPGRYSKEYNPRSYTKLDKNGNSLPDLAISWSMVRDNVTCLIWEVKKDDNSIHDKNKTYNWNDSQEVFIADLNKQKFGGINYWRLPTIKELSSIGDLESFSPGIDSNYFHNTMLSSFYWSSTTYAPNPDKAWYFDFDYFSVDGISDKSSSYYVRAVHLGQCN